jgi:hypothetical protein
MLICWLGPAWWIKVEKFTSWRSWKRSCRLHVVEVDRYRMELTRTVYLLYLQHERRSENLPISQLHVARSWYVQMEQLFPGHIWSFAKVAFGTAYLFFGDGILFIYVRVCTYYTGYICSLMMKNQSTNNHSTSSLCPVEVDVSYSRMHEATYLWWWPGYNYNYSLCDCRMWNCWNMCPSTFIWSYFPIT